MSQKEGNIYVEDKYLTDGRLDIEKVNPFVLTSHDSNYRTIGEIKAKAWNVGNAQRQTKNAVKD